MKIKVIRKRSPKGPRAFLIEDEKFWYCEKCKILYGEGETILEKEGWKFCPIHKKERIYSGDLDYWREDYELGETEYND